MTKGAKHRILSSLPGKKAKLRNIHDELITQVSALLDKQLLDSSIEKPARTDLLRYMLQTIALYCTRRLADSGLKEEDISEMFNRILDNVYQEKS